MHSERGGVHDPLEGVVDGVIVTGASRTQVPAEFVPVLSGVLDAVGPEVSVYLYGSVATGQARVGWSDVDVLTVGLDGDAARDLARMLSAEHESTCRAVEIAAARAGDFEGSHDEAYGNRVFLRHYCVHLAGPQLPVNEPFAADRRAARGFNGDIARHLDTWLAAAKHPATDLDELARTVARKTLLAVAGLVSVHDETWTTDRWGSATRWVRIDPARVEGVRRLASWVDGASNISHDRLSTELHSTVPQIVDRFDTDIGLWDGAPT